MSALLTLSHHRCDCVGVPLLGEMFCSVTGDMTFIFPLRVHILLSRINALLCTTAVLSGKELFNYNSSLFVDDDGCVDDQDDKLYQAEKELREQREEEAAREAAKKAQREQDRLLEEHKAEIAHVKRVESERLARSAKSTVKILVEEILVNEMLFYIPDDYDIQEDFTPFEFDNAEDEPVSGGQKVDGVEVNEALFGGDDDLDDEDEA